MQTNIINNISNLRIRSNIGQLIQVRNHVKMYPWRQARYARYSYLDNTKTPYTDPNCLNEFDKNKRQKKPWQVVVPKDKDNRFNAYLWNESYRSDPNDAKKVSYKRLESFEKSLLSRGHCRESKPYDPPDGVQDKVLGFLRESLVESGDQSAVCDKVKTDEDILAININASLPLKFSLLTKCIEEFGHDLPNSYLNDIDTVGDVVNYFMTPVRGMNSYAMMVRKQDNSLPENLHLISEPIRFDKQTDEYFQGYGALPGVVSRYPGLRGGKKYPTLNQDEFHWPDI